MQFEHQQGLFKPVSTEAVNFASSLRHKEIVYFEERKDRDLKFHAAYFALLNYIYSWLPANFKTEIPEVEFYKWLKVLLGNYTVIYTFKDGRQLIGIDSISFGRMSQKTFENYVREQLPLIYENVIYKLFPEDKAKAIIENIEIEFEKFLISLL